MVQHSLYERCHQMGVTDLYTFKRYVEVLIALQVDPCAKLMALINCELSRLEVLFLEEESWEEQRRYERRKIIAADEARSWFQEWIKR